MTLTRLYRFVLVLLAIFAGAPHGVAAPPDAPATTQPEPSKFLRVKRDADKKPAALETAIVRYLPAKPGREGLSVDLVGAVHVADKAYFEELNAAFEKYDAVLYELIAPPGARIAQGQRSNHPVSALQEGLKSMLDLDFQLERIDYTKANMVHADMSPDDFAKSMSDRGESFWTMFLKVMTDSMEQQAKLEASGKGLNSTNLLTALFDTNRAGALKSLMAEQFEGLGGSLPGLDGPDGSTIVTERNKVALEKLSEQIAGGKKKIAIFYGAGHLPDMEKRLQADFDMKRGDERWLTAWDLAPKQAPAAEVKK